MNNNTKPRLEDLNVIVAGQGGDGSLTVVNILADVLRTSGLRVYTERDVLSRIKGGITAATLRAYNGERLCISSHIDLMVAFDQAEIPKYAFRLNAKSTTYLCQQGGPCFTLLYFVYEYLLSIVSIRQKIIDNGNTHGFK